MWFTDLVIHKILFHHNWQSTPEQEHVKGFILEPSAKTTKELLRLKRNQLRHMTRLLTDHYHLKGHYSNWDCQIAPPMKDVRMKKK
jgi:hypothetical protein